jgi:hypothetical protein
MGHEIRKYLAVVDCDAPLSGHVEVDETFVGGKGKRKGRGKGKTIVLGMMERGGDVMTDAPLVSGTTRVITGAAAPWRERRGASS